jgi:DNA-binding transcriptional MerR regulator
LNTEPRYRIHAVAEMTGVPAPTLRAWERRYGIPRPGRSESAYRLYSDTDVAEVRQLVQLQTRGLAPSEAARLLLEGGPMPADPPPLAVTAAAPAPTTGAMDQALHRILDAIMNFDQALLEREVRGALYLGAPTEVYEGVLAPALREVGMRWERGMLDIAGEHLASRAISGALGELTGTLTRAGTGPRVVLACVEEDQHDLPLYGVALAVLEARHRPVILGQRTPPSAVAATVARLDPVAVGLSMTVPLAAGLEPRALFRAYGEAAAGRPWFVGGSASAAVAAEVRDAGGTPIEAASEMRRILEMSHRRS